MFGKCVFLKKVCGVFDKIHYVYISVLHQQKTFAQLALVFPKLCGGPHKKFAKAICSPQATGCPHLTYTVAEVQQHNYTHYTYNL